MNKDIAIVVVSFDKYSDIWDTFARCINTYWKDRPFPTYLITNEKDADYDGITIIKTGPEISWSRRVNKALNSISEKYVLLLLEDYLIDETVNNELVCKTIDYIVANRIDYFRIAPLPLLKGKADEAHAIPITEKTLYGVNLQAAIWDKSYLNKMVSEGDFNAWQFEARQKVGSENYIAGKCVASDIYIIHYLNGIIQGKWYIKTIEQLKEKGINIELGNRDIMTDKDMSRENFRNYLLHHTSPKIIKMLKPLAKKLGFKFVTD